MKKPKKFQKLLDLLKRHKERMKNIVTKFINELRGFSLKYSKRIWAFFEQHERIKCLSLAILISFILIIPISYFGFEYDIFKGDMRTTSKIEYKKISILFLGDSESSDNFKLKLEGNYSAEGAIAANRDIKVNVSGMLQIKNASWPALVGPVTTKLNFTKGESGEDPNEEKNCIKISVRHLGLVGTHNRYELDGSGVINLRSSGSYNAIFYVPLAGGSGEWSGKDTYQILQQDKIVVEPTTIGIQFEQYKITTVHKLIAIFLTLVFGIYAILKGRK